MILERVLAHYSALGWQVAEGGVAGVGPTAFHPDLLLERQGKRLAIRVSPEPLGTYEIGVFAARCKRARTSGLVVCEATPEVVDACDAARIDFLPSDRVGEPVVVGVPRPMSPPATAPPVAEELVAFREFSRGNQGPRLWRWAVVAAIWVAALTASAYYVALTLGS